MKRFLVFHPFMFAISPILFLFAHNMDEVPARDLLLPVLAVIVFTTIVFFLLRLVTKSYTKAGIITLWLLVLFFCYGYARDLLRSLREGSFFDFSRPGFLGSVWVLLFATVTYLVMKSRRDFVTLTKFFNIATGILVLISLVNIGIYQIGTFNPKLTERDDNVILQKPDQPRDIYYIILDMYAREDVLKDVYNYDNSEFIKYLTDKGFYVAPMSRSNYPKTVISLASSLNMEYINYLTDIIGAESINTEVPLEMIANSKVSRLLKYLGYRYIHVSSDWKIKVIGDYAEVYSHAYEIACGKTRIKISSFTTYQITNSALEPFVGPFISSLDRESVIGAFDTLADIPDSPGYKFVFVHIKCPWTTTVFERNGQYSPFDDDGNPPQAYLDRVTLVNQKVEDTIEVLLSKSDVTPIIILQGDHGFGPLEMNCRFGILNAYYFPDNDNRLLYDTITPVNSFRVLFNLYFDANYELLKDESYTVGYGRLYDFVAAPSEDVAD